MEGRGGNTSPPTQLHVLGTVNNQEGGSNAILPPNTSTNLGSATQKSTNSGSATNNTDEGRQNPESDNANPVSSTDTVASSSLTGDVAMETTTDSKSLLLRLSEQHAWLLAQKGFRNTEQYTRNLAQLKGQVSINEHSGSLAKDAISTVMSTDNGHWFHQYLASQAESQSIQLIDIANFLKKTCDVQCLDQELQYVEVLEKPVMITSPRFIMKNVWPSLAMNTIVNKLIHNRRTSMNAPQGLITPEHLMEGIEEDHLFEILATYFATTFDRKAGPSNETAISQLTTSMRSNPPLSEVPVALRLEAANRKNQETFTILKDECVKATKSLQVSTTSQFESSSAKTIREASIQATMNNLLEVILGKYHAKDRVTTSHIITTSRLQEMRNQISAERSHHFEIVKEIQSRVDTLEHEKKVSFKDTLAQYQRKRQIDLGQAIEQLQIAQQEELQSIKETFGIANPREADEDSVVQKLLRDKAALQARLESTQATLDDKNIVNAILTRRINAFGLKHALLPPEVQKQLNDTDLSGPQENLEIFTNLYQTNTRIKLKLLGSEFNNRHFSLTDKCIETAVADNIAADCVAGERTYEPIPYYATKPEIQAAMKVVQASASVTEVEHAPLVNDDDTMDVDTDHNPEPAQAKRTYSDAASGQAKRGRTADAPNSGPSRKKAASDRPPKFIKDTEFILSTAGVFRHSKGRNDPPKPIEHDVSSSLNKSRWDDAQDEIITIVHKANIEFLTLRVEGTNRKYYNMYAGTELKIPPRAKGKGKPDKFRARHTGPCLNMIHKQSIAYINDLSSRKTHDDNFFMTTTTSTYLRYYTSEPWHKEADLPKHESSKNYEYLPNTEKSYLEVRIMLTKDTEYVLPKLRRSNVTFRSLEQQASERSGAVTARSVMLYAYHRRLPSIIRSWTATRNGENKVYTLEHEMNDLGLHVEHMEHELQHTPCYALVGRNKHASKCETEKEAGEKMLSSILCSTAWATQTPGKLTYLKLMQRFEKLIRLNQCRNDQQAHMLLWIVGLVHVKRLILIYKHVAEYVEYPTDPELDPRPTSGMQQLRDTANKRPTVIADDLDITVCDDLDQVRDTTTEENASSDLLNNAGTDQPDETMAVAAEATPATE